MLGEVAYLRRWPGSRLLPRQLFIELGHVVVPGRLVATARHGCREAVLLPEALQPELSTVVSASVGQRWLRAGQRAGLLVDQPQVPVEACVWCGGAVRGERDQGIVSG